MGKENKLSSLMESFQCTINTEFENEERIGNLPDFLEIFFNEHPSDRRAMKIVYRGGVFQRTAEQKKIDERIFKELWGFAQRLSEERFLELADTFRSFAYAYRAGTGPAVVSGWIRSLHELVLQDGIENN